MNGWKTGAGGLTDPPVFFWVSLPTVTPWGQGCSFPLLYTVEGYPAHMSAQQYSCNKKAP